MTNLDYKISGYQEILRFCSQFDAFKRHSAIHNDEIDTLLYIHSSQREVTPIMLAHYFNVSKPRITKIINQLQAKHYIEKRPSSKDGRSQILLISEDGLNLLLAMESECYTYVNQLVDELGFGDFIQLIELLKRASNII